MVSKCSSRESNGRNRKETWNNVVICSLWGMCVGQSPRKGTEIRRLSLRLGQDFLTTQSCWLRLQYCNQTLLLNQSLQLVASFPATSPRSMKRRTERLKTGNGKHLKHPTWNTTFRNKMQKTTKTINKIDYKLFKSKSDDQRGNDGAHFNWSGHELIDYCDD